LPAPLCREPLGCRPALADALRCLSDTERPFALVGDWAGGGALLGCSPLRIAGPAEDPFELIASAGLGGADGGRGIGGGWVGYLGYELRHRLEHTQPSPPQPAIVPPFALAYYDHVIRRDAAGSWWFESLPCDERSTALAERRAWWRERLAQPPAARAARASDWRMRPSPAAHARLVAACRDRIHAGDLYQANICAELEGRLDGPALELFIRGVGALAPARAAYLEGPWGALVSLSPELFLERRGRRVRSAPIKGTRPRSADAGRAIAERHALEDSEKDRAENVMIVDLTRNDLGRVCAAGSVEVDSLASVQPHVGVWHMVSEVSGTLRPGVDDAALLTATFPPGSVTGAPKLAALGVIAELESGQRGAYTGAIGFASPVAGLELSVAIRTLEIARGRVRLGVGGGVVADSDPQAEAAELAVKVQPLLEAIGSALERRSGETGQTPRVRRLGAVPISRPDAARGIFETILVRDARAVALDAHLARLGASASDLYGTPLPAGLRALIAAAAERAAGDARLRVSARPGAGGRLDTALELLPLPHRRAARLRAWTLPGGLGAHKWADRRLIAELERHSPGSVPLLVDADGYVLETTRHNVFLLGRDGLLRTPPADGRILPGVARAALLEDSDAEALEAPVGLGELHDATAVLLTNALGTSCAISLDGTALHRGPHGGGEAAPGARRAHRSARDAHHV
jgi:para-aminobenzoate synthetase/4-amino-4-deoxychorismate lyase